MSTPTAVDLFCGAGGISRGLKDSGFDIRFSADVDGEYVQTYQANLPGHPCEQGDIRQLTGAHVLSEGQLAPGELTLLIGGPPCQGFSIIGSRLSHDVRNDLFLDFFRIASEVRPQALVIENVPGLATHLDGAYLNHILTGYDELGYDVAYAELLAAQYGTPQMRRRVIFIGFRRDLGIPLGSGFPLPYRGRFGIGQLPANRTVPAEEERCYVNTAEALGDLPPVLPGEECERYVGPPTTAYQMAMREGLNGELFNHYAPRLSAQTLERIRHLAPGQDWRDLPRELLPPSMQRALRKDHTRRYRRMRWDGVPRSVITRFRDPKSGEYTHPEQDRTLSIREAARLQGFPDSHVFLGTRASQYEQVGNAVPVQLAAAVASEVRLVLSGVSRPVLVSLHPRLRSPKTLCLPLDYVEEISA